MLQSFNGAVAIRAKSALTTSYVAGPVSPITDAANTEDTDMDFTSAGGAVDKEWMARTFTATASAPVLSAAVILGKTGAPAGTIHARIFTDVNNLPGLPVGGASDAITNTALSAAAGGASQTFTWTDDYPLLVSGSEYWLVLQPSPLYVYVNGVTEIRWRVDANGAVAASEFAQYQSDVPPFWTINDADIGADITVTYRDVIIGLGSANQLGLWVDFTIGASSGCQIKVEFSDDESSWYQESSTVVSGDDLIHSLMTRKIDATSTLIISIPVLAQCAKVSVLAIDSATNAEVGITAVTGMI